MIYKRVSYTDELAEVLLDDHEMMEFMKCALDTGKSERVLEASRTITTARDNREIVIRELSRSRIDD